MTKVARHVWLPGQVVGSTRLVRPIAHGGMSELWLGEARERLVAMKRLSPALVDEAEGRSLFEDEMQLAARLRHPAICEVLAFGHDGPVPWLQLELLAGDTVGNVLAQAQAAGTVWPAPLVASVIRQAADGLAYAHGVRDEAGQPLHIVHRDVAPQNLFVTWAGAVKVLDFGIARSALRLTRTRSGEFRGRLRYAAPEHARSEPLDGRADQFSLGATAFELLTRTRLHPKQSDYALLMSLSAGTTALPRADAVSPLVHPALADVVARMLERSRERRYGAMGEVSAALTGWLERFASPQTSDAQAQSTFLETVCSTRIAEQAELHRPDDAQKKSRLRRLFSR